MTRLTLGEWTAQLKQFQLAIGRPGLAPDVKTARKPEPSGSDHQRSFWTNQATARLSTVSIQAAGPVVNLLGEADVQLQKSGLEALASIYPFLFKQV